MIPPLNNKPSLLSVLLYHYITGTISAPSDWTSVGTWLELPYYYKPDRESSPLTEPLIREIFYHSKITNHTDVCMFYLLVGNLGHCLNTQQQNELFIYLQEVSIKQLEGELES